jgi:hypothetical protein
MTYKSGLAIDPFQDESQPRFPSHDEEHRWRGIILQFKASLTAQSGIEAGPAKDLCSDHFRKDRLVLERYGS